jgi:hypothetical protein
MPTRGREKGSIFFFLKKEDLPFSLPPVDLGRIAARQ